VLNRLRESQSEVFHFGPVPLRPLQSLTHPSLTYTLQFSSTCGSSPQASPASSPLPSSVAALPPFFVILLHEQQLSSLVPPSPDDVLLPLV